MALTSPHRPGECPSHCNDSTRADGVERHLGIPNLVDRVIQQAIVLILTPIFDPDFSESSFGYRPYRSAQGAVKQVQRIIRSGRRQCVDMDLSKFFDRVQHDEETLRGVSFLRDGLARGLCFGPSEDNFHQARQMASPPSSSLLLEAVAEVGHPDPQADVLWLELS
jgi:hypothetical protein